MAGVSKDASRPMQALRNRMSRDVEPVVIFHNPNCGTSRKVLEAIRGRGIEPQVIRYLQAGWTKPQLRRVLDALGLKAHDILRMKEGGASDLVEKDEEAVLAAMVRDPALVERPIVLTAKGAALCRPAERVDGVL